jgi:hypothetical protein
LWFQQLGTFCKNYETKSQELCKKSGLSGHFVSRIVKSYMLQELQGETFRVKGLVMPFKDGFFQIIVSDSSQLEVLSKPNINLAAK